MWNFFRFYNVFMLNKSCEQKLKKMTTLFLKKSEKTQILKFSSWQHKYIQCFHIHILILRTLPTQRAKKNIYIATRSWRTSLRAYGRFFGGFYAMWKFELVSACNGLKFWQQVHKTFGLSGTEGFFQNKHFSNFYQGFCSFAIKFKNFFKKS